MRTILVTGAGGFVGSALAEGFAAAGHAVTGLDRAFDGDSADIVQIVGNVDRETLETLGSFDTIVHAAAITSTPQECGIGLVEHVRANCDMLLAALAFCERTGARDFVFLSSSGVFEESPAPVLLETTPVCGISPYALAKRAGETFLEGAAAFGTRALAVRLGPIYGPGERVRASRRTLSPLRTFIAEAAAGQAPVVRAPGSVRDWTFAPDLAAALLALLDRRPAVEGIVHLTSGITSGDEALAERIAAIFGKDIAIGAEGGPARRPMLSERLVPWEQHDWTALADGLSRVVKAVR